MSKENPKITNVSIMVYRKFTRDFDSLGFRLGLSVEVRDGDARDSWYQGRLFLKERIKEEEEEIEKKFGLLKKQKEKGKISLGVKGVGYKEVELMEIPKEVGVGVFGSVDADIIRIINETGIEKKAIVQMVVDKKNELRGLVSDEGAVWMVGRDLNVDMGNLGGVKKREQKLINIKSIIITSSKAVLVELFSGENKWIPKSCIEGDVNRLAKGAETVLLVDVWFLEKEGIVY